MTLFINDWPVLDQPTGIGVYAQSIFPALEHFPHHLAGGAGGRASLSARLNRLCWSQFGLPHEAASQGASLIFTPAPEGYLGPQSIPQVVMVHDLRPISHPERSFQSLYFRFWVPPLLRCCQHVITNSRFTAGEIQRCIGLPEDRITVIPLGYDRRAFYPTTDQQQVQPYLLHVGQAYPHKNLRRLIVAFSAVAKCHPDVILLLAGKSHPTESPALQRLVAEFGLQRRVIFRPYVPPAELPDLYRGALALVYPSLWEGFGLPILEAMASGTPVLTSLGSGTQDVAGDAALLIDPTNTAMLQEGLGALLQQPSIREQMRQRGLQRATLFDWSRTAEQTAAVIERFLV